MIIPINYIFHIITSKLSIIKFFLLEIFVNFLFESRNIKIPNKMYYHMLYIVHSAI